MTNDISDGKPSEEDFACIALSKNDSSVMFASGGKVSLYNMMTFMVMTMFMPSPLATTFWHSILKKIILLPLGWRILPLRYRISELMRSEPNLRVTKSNHRAFISQTLNALVSSGADAQLCMRSIDKWEKAKIKVHTSTSCPSIPLTVKTQA
ncbi:hypothetical protein Pint_21685 [Pistacia integerrima]|uniref:Uncharacterized protein n=1 Tax=Pistacia integerrima TaxID=434235 RepID=A0ACC0XB03_9ROSI|nr:hypothetical protein Pint_21685 [Pistacia integerrima]